MKRSPTADDPAHYTTRDGRTMPVSGTHDGRTVHEGRAMLTLNGAPCLTCQTMPTRILASAFPLGMLVQWPFGRTGTAHGRVLEHGRTRVSIYWHARRPRPVWLPASRLRPVGAELPAGPRTITNCRTCADGR